jgi:hypothetical protein
MRTQIAMLNAYARQIEGTAKNNAKVLDRQITLKNDLIARRARKEAAQELESQPQSAPR